MLYVGKSYIYMHTHAPIVRICLVNEYLLTQDPIMFL